MAHRLVGDLSKKLFECHCRERADVVFASRPVVIIILRTEKLAHPAVEARMVERCDPLFLKHPVTPCPQPWGRLEESDLDAVVEPLA